MRTSKNIMNANPRDARHLAYLRKVIGLLPSYFMPCAEMCGLCVCVREWVSRSLSGIRVWRLSLLETQPRSLKERKEEEKKNNAGKIKRARRAERARERERDQCKPTLFVCEEYPTLLQMSSDGLFMLEDVRYRTITVPPVAFVLWICGEYLHRPMLASCTQERTTWFLAKK